MGNLRSEPAASQRKASSLYAGSIDIEETSPAGAVRVYRATVTCGTTSGSLCRRTADCLQYADIECQRQAGHRYGKCAFPPFVCNIAFNRSISASFAFSSSSRLACFLAPASHASTGARMACRTFSSRSAWSQYW